MPLLNKLLSKMRIECIMCFVVFVFGAVNCEESFVRGVTIDRKLLDSEPSDIFNKTLASKDNSKVLRGVRTPATPATRVMPSYSPPVRVSFTPPLPPAYNHPFVNKPTLRGSNSDSSSSIANRRPIPPPPPFKLSSDEMIPIRPPDLVSHDTKKKTLNTPSFKKVVEPSYTETSSTTSSNKGNETFDIVQILPYPSVSRILSGGSGRKHDALQDILTRLDHEPRTIKQEIVKSLVPPISKPEPPEEHVDIHSLQEEHDLPEEEEEEEDDSEEDDEEEEEIVEVTKEDTEEEAQKQEVVVEKDVGKSEEPRKLQVLGIAWDVHVYLIAALFSLLAICSLINIIRLTYLKHLLSLGYFISLHGILLIIGCMRSFFLIYDPYNVNKSLPEPVANLLLNMVFPLLTSAFAILFLFLLTAAEVKALNNKVQKAWFLGIFIVIYIGLSLCVHVYSGDSEYAMLLPLICQCVFIVMCVSLGLAYLYVYKSLTQCCVAKGYAECEGGSVSQAVRVTLATAMLSLLMAAVHLYGMLAVYDGGRPQTWLWWGYQLSVRVIEVSMCGLLAWAGMQPAPPHQPTSVEDMYPAICTTNQAYTLRSNKHYDDSMYPLNSLQRTRTLDRSVLQPSPSMLVAENGFVRFRTDAEMADEPYQPPPSLHQYA